MNKRKIIQITAAGAGGDENPDIELYALCNDGTVWVQLYDFKVKETYWKQIYPIPQPEAEGGEE